MSSSKIINRGTGAGGSQTNANGIGFEQLVSNHDRLVAEGYRKLWVNYRKKAFVLTKQFPDKVVYYMCQHNFKKYFVDWFDVPEEEIYLRPDEVFVVQYKDKMIIKILEVKNQNNSGSVEQKLYGCGNIRKCYERRLLPSCLEIFEDNNTTVELALCCNNYFKTRFLSKKPKYVDMTDILRQDGITIMYGEDPDYPAQVDKWLHSA